MRVGVLAMILVAGRVAAAESVDLLRSLPTEVAVSSTVANGKIVPAHLVDGNLATAWNSKTNELVGAWIAVRVPDQAQVQTIQMTIGFTANDPKLGDLFTQNPRIKRVKVTRNGTLLREVTFDVDRRDLQNIAIGTDGGDFKIEVLEVVAGSKKSWREICVSELAVRGALPPGGIESRSTPTVRVGPFPAATAKPTVPAPQEAPVLLVLATPKATLVVLGEPPAQWTADGAPVEVARQSTYGTRDKIAAFQPIVKGPERTALGRTLQLQGATKASCKATITQLAVFGAGELDRATTTTMDAAVFATKIWSRQDSAHALVGVVTPVNDASCDGALFATAVGVKPARGKIDRSKATKTKLYNLFMNDPEGSGPISERYQLNDLDAEYGDAEKNERAIPAADRYNESYVQRNFAAVAACDAKDMCVGAVDGSYHSYAGHRWYAIDRGVVLGGGTSCNSQDMEKALAAVDVDGDGSIELVYATGSGDGIGYVGRTHAGSAELFETPCWRP